MDTERTGGFQVEHEFEFGGLLDREVGRLLTFENSAGVDAELGSRIRRAV